MEWKRGPIIGRGSFATVYLATTSTGDLFAVKSTDLSNSGLLQKEENFLSKLSSNRIIECLGFDVDYIDNKPMYNLLMEYAPCGTISDVIKKQGGSLDESLIRSYTHQILLGLDYLHLNHLVHCDIKCQNILVCKDGVKIGDLGCARSAVSGGAAASAFSGTPVFMAPEVARGEEQGFAADVWALGCAVIEMATGFNPWPELKDPVAALYRIGHSGDLPEFPGWLSEEAKDFLGKCLKRDAKERWTAKELLQHPFVYNSNSEKVEGFTRNSPTSMLDQCFWDSLETSETSPARTHIIDFSGDSPAERIKQLVEVTSSSVSYLPNWAEEEGWITVRTSQIKETEKISEQNLDTDLDDDVDDDDEGESTHTESNWFSNSYAEEGQESLSVRDNDFLMLENVIVETSSGSVTRIIDFENIINDNYLIVDFNFNFDLTFALISPIIPFACIGSLCVTTSPSIWFYLGFK